MILLLGIYLANKCGELHMAVYFVWQSVLSGTDCSSHSEKMRAVAEEGS